MKLIDAFTIDIDQYHYKADWSEEDQRWVATCAEFPSLSWLAITDVDALSGIHVLVAEVVVDMIENGEKPPPPGHYQFPS